MAEIVLAGCAPIPLASYLKALGAFRLVAEQKDKGARGCWRDEAFVLDTTVADEELVRFFLDDYRPSPIVSPWNGGSGFYFREGKSNEKDSATGKRIKSGVRNQPTEATRVIEFIANATADRFQPLRAVVLQVRQTLTQRGHEHAPADEEKRALVAQLRRSLPEEGTEWLDAAVVLSGEDLGKPPLLGTGGNDGNLDFSSNFMQRLAELFAPSSGAPLAGADPWLRNALFGAPAASLSSGAIGQFAPGAAGGPNATTGFERETLINPWDYVLMLEGALLFASSASRRLESAGLSYPFTVNTANTDGASAALIDEKRKSKGKIVGNSFEIWMPLWEQPAGFDESRALLSEGRTTFGRRRVRDGLDFARAVAILGVSRGISAFERYTFLQRRGDAISATPKGRIRVQPRPKARLLSDLDAGDWLTRFRRYARELDGQSKNFVTPHHVQALALRLDEAIFAMTQDASARAVQRVLIAVGETAAYLVSSPKARDPKEGKQKPPPRLRSAWFHAAADNCSLEFHVAAALAGLGQAPASAGGAVDGDADADSAIDDGVTMEEDETREDDADSAETAASEEERRGRAIPPPPLRAHLAPLDEKSWYERFRKWSDKGALAVWSGGSLERNLAAVVERRLLFAAQRNLDGGPFDARSAADLTSVLAFLSGRTDDARIAALAQGLAWADAPNFVSTQTAQPEPLPLAYALLKPLFAPIEDVRAIKSVSNEIRLPVPPGLIARLRTGDVGPAVTLACQRARASGLPVTFEPCAKHVAGLDGPRLLASLLIPICRGDLKRVLKRAYPALFDDANMPTEDPADAA